MADKEKEKLIEAFKKLKILFLVFVLALGLTLGFVLSVFLGLGAGLPLESFLVMLLFIDFTLGFSVVWGLIVILGCLLFKALSEKKFVGKGND